MNKYKLTSIGLALFSYGIYANESNVYEVVKGDSFSTIVKRYLSRPDLPIKSYNFLDNEYKDAYQAFLKQNSHIVDTNKIFVGQKINVPAEYRPKATPLSTRYIIQSGDTLYEIMDKFYKKEKVKAILSLLKKVNPYQLRNINYIQTGSTLLLPTESFIAKYEHEYTQRKIASTSPAPRFRSSNELEDEIYNLSTIVAKNYIHSFKEIINAKGRVKLMGSLKETLEVSREHEHQYLEGALLGLISTSLQLKEEDEVQSNIGEFFKVWKRIRSTRKKNQLK